MKLSFALAGCAALFSVTQPADARLGSSLSMNTAGMRPFLSWLTKGSFGSSSSESPPPASRPGSHVPRALLLGQSGYSAIRRQPPEVDAPVGIPAPHTATSATHFVDSGDSCYALHFAGAPISFTPQMIHTCPAPVCSPGTNNCALATLPLVAPLDLQAAAKQARASEMSRAGLLMLKRAFDSTRVVRDWERLEATMVCVEKEPVLLERVTPWVEFFGSVSLEAFDWLSDKATSSVRSVICLCRQFSFYDMPARTTRPKDIPNSTFAEMLERFLLRKAFADALLAGWIGLRWCLVSADHRVRLLRSFYCMRRRSSRNGFRQLPKHHDVVTNTVRRMKRLAVVQQNVDKYLSVSQLLLLNPSSTLEDVDRMMTRLDGRINREREQAFHCHMRLYADFEGLFATAMEKMLLHEAKVKAHVRQEFADAKVAIREEVRQELRREMKDHTNYVDKLNSQRHANFEQLLGEREAKLRKQASDATVRQQFAAEMQDLRRQSAEAVINAEARTRRQFEDAEARTRWEFENVEARIRWGIRQESAEALANAEARIRWDIRQESAHALARAEERAINAFNRRPVLIEQAPDGAVGGETTPGNACYSEQRVKELVASAVAEERERTKELVYAAVAEGLEGYVSVGNFEALSTVVDEKLKQKRPTRRSYRGGKKQRNPPTSQTGGDEDGAPSDPGAAVGGNS